MGSKTSQLFILVLKEDLSVHFWKPFLQSIKPDDVILTETNTALFAGLSVTSCELFDHQFARITVNVTTKKGVVELVFLVPRKNILAVVEGKALTKETFGGFLGGTA